MSKSPKGFSGGMKCHLFPGNTDITRSEETDMSRWWVGGLSRHSLEAGIGGLPASIAPLCWERKIREVIILKKKTCFCVYCVLFAQSWFLSQQMFAQCHPRFYSQRAGNLAGEGMSAEVRNMKFSSVHWIYYLFLHWKYKYKLGNEPNDWNENLHSEVPVCVSAATSGLMHLVSLSLTFSACSVSSVRVENRSCGGAQCIAAPECSSSWVSRRFVFLKQWVELFFLRRRFWRF